MKNFILLFSLMFTSMATAAKQRGVLPDGKVPSFRFKRGEDEVDIRFIRDEATFVLVASTYLPRPPIRKRRAQHDTGV